MTSQSAIVTPRTPMTISTIVVVERQCQQVEGKISAEHRIDRAGRRGTEEPHERNPQRSREESDQGCEPKSDDPRRTGRDHHIRPRQYAQVGDDKQADREQDPEENCHTIFERQPIAMALAQLRKPVVFEGDAERRLKDDDAEASSQDVGGIAIEPVHKCNVVATSALHQGTDQGQRRPQEQKQIEDLEHRSPSNPDQECGLITPQLPFANLRLCRNQMRSYFLGKASSSARLSSKTLTRGSPKIHRLRGVTCCSTRAAIRAVATPRALATRAT